MKKLTAGLLSIALATSFTYAQSAADLDKEIARMKKENELLELKAQNERLKRGEDSNRGGAEQNEF